MYVCMYVCMYLPVRDLGLASGFEPPDLDRRPGSTMPLPLRQALESSPTPEVSVATAREKGFLKSRRRVETGLTRRAGLLKGSAARLRHV